MIGLYGYPIQRTLIYVLEIMKFLILIRAIISWLPLGRYNAFVRFVYQVTEPILAPARELINRSPIGGNMMVDFSPMIVWLAIDVIIIPLVKVIIKF
mgnify:CR=1 FL=1